jgi:hypothetical protein
MKVKAVLTRVRYLRSRRSALGRRLVLRCSENNVRKFKNRYKYTCFVVAKIRKSEVRKWRDWSISISALNYRIQLQILAFVNIIEANGPMVTALKPFLQYTVPYSSFTNSCQYPPLHQPIINTKCYATKDGTLRY